MCAYNCRNIISWNRLKEIVDKFKPNYIFFSKITNNLVFSNYSKLENTQFENIYKNIKKVSVKIDENLFILLSTSGSTGSGKLVKITKANIHSNTKAITQYLDMNKKDITLTNLPMSYAYGLSVINSHLYAGAKLILTDNQY